MPQRAMSSDETQMEGSPNDQPSSPKALYRRVLAIIATGLDCGAYPRDFWLLCALLFLMELGCSLLGASSLRLIEMAICRHHFRRDPIESECRNPEVQIQLAYLFTALSTCSILVGKGDVRLLVIVRKLK